MSSDARAILLQLSVGTLCVVAFAGCTPASAGRNASASSEKTALPSENSPVPANVKLTDTLVVTDQQAGFVGEQGTRYLIAPDGAFEVVQFINEKSEPPGRKGTLPREQITALAALVERELPGLPTQIGKPPAVNAHSLVVELGFRTWTFYLPAGQSLDQAELEHSRIPNSAEARLLRVVREVRNAIDEPRR